MIEFKDKEGNVTNTIRDEGLLSCVGIASPKIKIKIERQWTDSDINHLSVLAGFDPSHKVELGLVRSVVRTILRDCKDDN